MIDLLVNSLNSLRKTRLAILYHLPSGADRRWCGVEYPVHLACTCCEFEDQVRPPV